MGLSEENRSSFEENGYLVVGDALSKQETCEVQRWVEEVRNWPIYDDSIFMPYTEINSTGDHVLSRTENFAASHAGLNGLLRGKKLMAILRELAGEEMILFKEKINYKLAGSGGFAAHIDAGAYTQVKNVEHLTILLAADSADMANGCMEVVKGSHKMKIPIGSDNCIGPDWTEKQDWIPVELEAGQVLIFGSYLAHRSAANHSQHDRKALYATYNKASEGDLREEYYRQRLLQWPPTHLRKPGDQFEKGAFIHGESDGDRSARPLKAIFAEPAAEFF